MFGTSFHIFEHKKATNACFCNKLNIVKWCPYHQGYPLFNHLNKEKLEELYSNKDLYNDQIDAIIYAMTKV